jgi:CBS domain-containing protein
MLPAFPLDGGRVLRSILWRRGGDFERATARAARVGRSFGYGMVALGFLGAFAGLPGLLWLGLIGFFLIVAGRAEEAGAVLQSTFKGSGLRGVMAVRAATLDADDTVADALRDSFAPLGYHAFPVVERGRAVGLLTIDQVEAIPSGRRESSRVGDFADRDPSVFVDEDVTIDELLANPSFVRHRRAVVRREDGQIGIISASAIERAVRARRMLDNAESLSATSQKASVT